MSYSTYQEDEVLSLHDLQQLNDAAVSQAPQDADLSLNAPLIHRLLQDHIVTWSDIWFFSLHTVSYSMSLTKAPTMHCCSCRCWDLLLLLLL